MFSDQKRLNIWLIWAYNPSPTSRPSLPESPCLHISTLSHTLLKSSVACQYDFNPTAFQKKKKNVYTLPGTSLGNCRASAHEAVEPLQMWCIAYNVRLVKSLASRSLYFRLRVTALILSCCAGPGEINKPPLFDENIILSLVLCLMCDKLNGACYQGHCLTKIKFLMCGSNRRA